jgi:ABC-type multidrug transport system ATPase subunit
MLFSAHHLSKSYRAGTPGCSAAARVLARVSLELDAGAVVGVAGGRACGKTTLVRCMAGLARPDAGVLRWAPGAERPRIVALAPAALPFETVQDILDRVCADPMMDADRLGATLSRLGLDGLLSRSQVALTTDERARLALAIGLVTRHPLLLLDGTADAIAARARPGVRDALRRYAAEGGAVLLTGRDGEAVAALAAAVLRVVDGRLIAGPAGVERAVATRVAERTPAPAPPGAPLPRAIR